jgi:hypothetical protein
VVSAMPFRANSRDCWSDLRATATLNLDLGRFCIARACGETFNHRGADAANGDEVGESVKSQIVSNLDAQRFVHQ